jgi:hypothetical protein
MRKTHPNMQRHVRRVLPTQDLREITIKLKGTDIRRVKDFIKVRYRDRGN